jgi:hypothetical protein
MVVRSDVGVWMNDESRCESVARMVAVDCMMALGLDHINDFRTRDKIIVAISDRINRALSEVADEDIYRRAMESMASQFICPKMTALDMAKTQLGIR